MEHAGTTTTDRKLMRHGHRALNPYELQRYGRGACLAGLRRPSYAAQPRLLAALDDAGRAYEHYSVAYDAVERAQERAVPVVLAGLIGASAMATARHYRARGLTARQIMAELLPCWYFLRA